MRLAVTIGLVGIPLTMAQELPAQNLIHHWDFDSDSVVIDVAADSARNGSLVGGARLSGGVLVLDGKSSYLQFAAHFVPTSPAYTVAFFARADAAANAGRNQIISQGAPGASFFLGIASNGASLSAGDNWLEVASARFAADGAYHHYALTMSASEASLYVDGALVATNAPFAGGAGGSATRLGRGSGNSNVYFAGEIDEVRIYSDALSAEQVQELVRGATPRTDSRSDNSQRAMPLPLEGTPR